LAWTGAAFVLVLLGVALFAPKRLPPLTISRLGFSRTMLMVGAVQWPVLIAIAGDLAIPANTGFGRWWRVAIVGAVTSPPAIALSIVAISAFALAQLANAFNRLHPFQDETALRRWLAVIAAKCLAGTLLVTTLFLYATIGAGFVSSLPLTVDRTGDLNLLMVLVITLATVIVIGAIAAWVLRAKHTEATDNPLRSVLRMRVAAVYAVFASMLAAPAAVAHWLRERARERMAETEQDDTQTDAAPDGFAWITQLSPHDAVRAIGGMGCNTRQIGLVRREES
jgi:hypothetical protein